MEQGRSKLTKHAQEAKEKKVALPDKINKHKSATLACYKLARGRAVPLASTSAPRPRPPQKVTAATDMTYDLLAGDMDHLPKQLKPPQATVWADQANGRWKASWPKMSGASKHISWTNLGQSRSVRSDRVAHRLGVEYYLCREGRASRC